MAFAIGKDVVAAADDTRDTHDATGALFGKDEVVLFVDDADAGCSLFATVVVDPATNDDRTVPGVARGGDGTTAADGGAGEEDAML